MLVPMIRRGIVCRKIVGGSLIGNLMGLADKAKGALFSVGKSAAAASRR